MKDIYRAQLDVAAAMPSDAEALLYLSAILRSLLQAVAITSLETALKATPTIDDELNIRQYLDRFGQPSDGLPVEILEALVPTIRSLVFRRFIDGWFEKTEESNQSLAVALNEWVEFRNKRPSHGVLDASIITAWSKKTADLIQRILRTTEDCLPKISGAAFISQIGDVVIPITLPLVIEGQALVIGKISCRKGIWKMQGQILSWTNARDVIVDLNPGNLFANDSQIVEKFKWSEVACGTKTKLVLSNIPVRQTSNFVGRKKELEKLAEWLRDVIDSRTCLVYGDGGFGKTTLVLEFFNGLLEDGVEEENVLPSVISFYTAKKTKWTEEGLVHFKGISDAMEDGVRELIYSLDPVLGKEWYKVEGRSLIEKASARFAQEGFTRDDVMLIIDNTETLATSQQDAEVLAEFLAQVAKKIGRVVITSRRRELLAAVPISVSQLSESEALQLMQRLGGDYGARAVVQAGESKLRSACNQLMCKPLLIDTLVRYIARSNSGIQEGLEQILRKTSDELLEFLYEDAWARMNRLVQEVYMVLVTLASPIDGKCIGDVCIEIGVLHAEFQASLGETYFASILDHGDSYDLEIVELAKEFFRKKKKRLPLGDTERIENIAFKVDKLATDRYEIKRSFLSDRVADGFRSDYAKAAKIATIKKRYDEAIDSYELALLEEPLNGALHERYASFLLRNLGRAPDALQYAQRATELDPNSADGWLTLGLVKYKLNDLPGGDDAIDRAKSFGKTDQLCMLRKAIARFHSAKLEPYGRRAIPLLKEAEMYVDKAIRAPDSKDFYFLKNRQEADKYKTMIRTLISRINRREVISDGLRTG